MEGYPTCHWPKVFEIVTIVKDKERMKKSSRDREPGEPVSEAQRWVDPPAAKVIAETTGQPEGSLPVERLQL